MPKKYQNVVSNTPSQYPRVQVPSGRSPEGLPFELVHALFKANNGDMKASIEAVKEGFKIYKVKSLK